MIALSSRLAMSRLTENRSGLDGLALIAFVVTSWLALTVAGGTWMFFTRGNNPPQAFLDAAAQTDTPLSPVALASMYPSLAVIACAILVVPILSLGGAAARLGASGRARRLASLRLIGMTGGEVILMSVIESLVLAALGFVIGAVLWAVSLPLWTAVGFMATPIEASEMVLPWWGIVGLALIILVLAALSTIIGLQRVRISPLGVARRESTRKLTLWRMIVAAVAVGLFYWFTRGFNIMGASIGVFIAMGAFLALVVATVNLVGPLVIQLAARPFAQTSNPGQLLAMRRLIADPKAAWRNVAAVALLGLIAAFTISVPRELSEGEAVFMIQFADIRTGAMITIAIGLVLAATSTLINQASATVDRADQTIALTRMGTQRHVFTQARIGQVLLPMMVTLAVSIPTGLVLALPMMTQMADLSVSSFAMIIGVIVAGVVLAVGAALACSPIESRILATDYRPND